jgi:hypothetical protein
MISVVTLHQSIGSATYGNCFTFNSNISGKSKLSWTSSLPGASMGLNVVLNLEQDEYMKNGQLALVQGLFCVSAFIIV